MLEEYKHRKGTDVPSMPLPELVEDEQLEYRVEAILALRGKGKRAEYLVKWSGWPEDYATWEPFETVEQLEALDVFEANGRQCKTRKGNVCDT